MKNFPWFQITFKILIALFFTTSWITELRCEKGHLTPSYFKEETEDSVIIHVKSESQVKDTKIKLSNSSAPTQCQTNKGEPGECKPFHECFPLLAKRSQRDFRTTSVGIDYDDQDDMESSELSWTELQDEVFYNTKDQICSTQNPATNNSNFENESIPICCAVQSLDNKDLPLALVKASEFKVDEVGANTVLPTTCGRVFSSQIRRTEDNRDNKTQKITGGKDVRPGQYPWMVAIFGKNGKHTCGASLITNNMILTASHCLFTYNANDIRHLKVHLGDYNIMTSADGSHEVRKISKIILHKGFNSNTYFNDIAVMKLDSPVQFTNKIQPICLPSVEMNGFEGYNSVVMGWGRNRQWGQASAVLKAVEIPVWKHSACQKVFSTFAPGRLMESNICAGDGKRNKDACIGDSGGPLVFRDENKRWTQIGIVSWGKGCGSFPGVYTSTQHFLNWISKNIQE